MAATQYSTFAALTVHATADRVWETLTDLDGAKSMLPSLVSIERLGAPEYGVGTRWRETRRMFGTNATEVLEVTAVKPEWSTTVHAENRGVIYTTHFSLLPSDNFTVLTMYLTAENPNPSATTRIVHALTAPLAIRITSKAMKKDLTAFGAAAEARSAAAR